MPAPARPRGRPGRYAEYDRFLAALPRPMTKRPHYLNGLGVFRGRNDDTAWVKVHLRHGGTYKGKTCLPGGSVEIKLGRLESWPWEALEQKRTELQGRADRNEPLEEQHAPLFSEFAREWLDRRKGTRSYGTARVHVERHLIPEFGALSLDQITLRQINTWTARRRETQKPATVHRERATLSTILSDAVRNNLIEANPCDQAEPIRGIVGRQRYLSGEEILTLLAAAEGVADWMPDILTWALHSGMRIGEIWALKWNDIRELPTGQRLAQINNPKSDRPRDVSLTRTMGEVLERQKRRKRDGDDRIFPVAKMTFRRKWEAARQRANLPDVTVHDLRRTNATMAAVSGVDLRTLAGRLGHADLAMLEKHYAALDGTASTQAAEKLQAVYDKIEKK